MYIKGLFISLITSKFTSNYKANTRDEAKNLLAAFKEACKAKELPIQH
jgi:hypothetical protein